MSITGIPDIDLLLLKEASFNDAMKFIQVSKLMRDLYYNDIVLKRKRDDITKRINIILHLLVDTIDVIYLQPSNKTILYASMLELMMQYNKDTKEDDRLVSLDIINIQWLD